ncbi:MAG: hypothetical protein MHM6MM_000265 [Cercozoa sp. M6MM]
MLRRPFAHMTHALAEASDLPVRFVTRGSAFLLTFGAGGLLYKRFLSKYQLFFVDGASMEPQLRHGDVLVVKKWNEFAEPDIRLGSVLVMLDPFGRDALVKRVVGTPGARVHPKDEILPQHVPKHHVWVEGDNAAVSRDSRSMGALSLSLGWGHATMLLSRRNGSWLPSLTSLQWDGTIPSGTRVDNVV